MSTLAKVQNIINKVSLLQKQGYSLQQISKRSYEMREAGEDMIYFGWGTKNEYLVANPVTKQKEYKEFFSQVAEGSKVFPKYSLYIYQDKIEFTENVKVDGKIQKISLVK
mgnify:CR=1 FL=1